MWTFAAVISLVRKNSIRIACCTLLFWCVSVSGQENRSGTTSRTMEQKALQVLNDSDWAHTVKPTLQDAPCTYQNPAFPGLFPEDKGALNDARAPSAKPDAVKPDHSEYLIRFQSA